MAKVSFTKLNLAKSIEPIIIKINDQEIEVKQYLPINEKLELISNVINLSADENNFPNPVKIQVFTILEIMYNYTNINFTEKQKEDPTKLYDLLVSNGIIGEIISAIPDEEYYTLLEDIEKCANSIYTYRNSVMGILENISQDYSNLNLDATEIQKKLADPQNMDLLKGILTKLG